MNCLESQKLITPFINNELNDRKLEEFTSHIRTCEECDEELGVYYTLLTAMRQLDEDEELSSDFTQELNEKLDDTEEYILSKKINFVRKHIILLGIILAMVFVFSLSKSSLRLSVLQSHVDEESDFILKSNYKTIELKNIEEELEEFLQAK